MRIVNVEQRTSEWHVWRNTGVTASEAAVIMGRDPEMTWWRLWRIKRGLSPVPDLSRNPYVIRGVENEPLARKAFEERHGLLMVPLCIEHDEHPFLRASLDGYCDEHVIWEGKCPAESTFAEVREQREQSDPYQRYWPQVQAQLCVSGATHAWLTFHMDEKTYEDFRVERDETFIADYIRQASAFYHLLSNGIEPDKNPALDDFIPSGDVLKLWENKAPAILKLIKKRQEAEATVKSIVKMLEQSQKELVETIPAGFMNGDAAGLHITRYLQRGAVDYKAALAKLAPAITDADLDAFRRTSQERVRLSKSDDHAPPPGSMETEVVVMPVNESFYF